jgi:catechol 2,3-dioxygenase
VSAIDPSLRIRSVSLAVAELSRSVDFYERVLGLTLLAREQRSARLGAGDGAHTALTLSELDDATLLPTRASGLYHVAWLHPSRAALAHTMRRIAAARWPFEGASDHGVSEALYLSDPDGLGIEIYADRPRERWRRTADGSGVEMVTLPLDIEDLLAQAANEETSPAMPAGTAVGHVHLKVSDVARTEAFYRDTLGFEEQAQLPSAAFVSAGGYHHHLGLNSWQSAGAGPAPATAPGLRLIEFELGDERELEALAARVAERDPQALAQGGRDGELSLRDPDGELLAFSAAAGGRSAGGA